MHWISIPYVMSGTKAKIAKILTQNRIHVQVVKKTSNDETRGRDLPAGK